MIEYQAFMMGSPITLVLPTDSPALARAVFQLIKQQENHFTVNRLGSELMNVNQSAGRCAVEVSDTVFELVALAHQISLLPGSLFNLAIGPLVKCWKIGFQGSSPPSSVQIEKAMTRIDPRDVVLDAKKRQIFLRKPEMEIDLGAIAKGYIADNVCRFLAQENTPYALINLGGNIHTLNAPDENGWLIGLKRPFGQADERVANLTLSGRSVVTSGIYERFFVHNRQHYHHILDWRTGYPLDNDLLSVTVISASSLIGDIYSTLLYGMGLESALSWLEYHPEIEAIFITRDGQLRCSSQHHYRCFPNEMTQ